MRGSWRQNKDCNIWTSPAPPDIAVCHSRSRSPDAQPEARGPSSLLDDGFLYCILSPTRLISNSLIHVFTELYNSSIAHSIFGMACLLVIKRKWLSCSSQVTLLRCISIWVYHGNFTLSQFFSQVRRDFFSILPSEYVTSIRCITLEWHIRPGRRSIYNITTWITPELYDKETF